MPRAFILKISEVIRETPDAVTLRFNQPAFGRIWYYAGQFLTIRVEIAGMSYYRSYSLSSSPQLDNYLDLTVKRVEGGRVSNYINDHFTAGQLVEVLQPRGKFNFIPGLKKKRHLMLFAAGSGITPLMGILKTALFLEPASTVHLIYANRSPETTIFAERLSDLLNRFSGRLKITFFWSGLENNENHGGISGRITANQVRNMMAEAPEAETLYYLCGPNGFMEVVEGGLTASGVSGEEIHKEQFFADLAEEKKITDALGVAREVIVRLQEKEHLLKVPPGASILDAALSQGLLLPYSCRRGVCSTCMGVLVRGEISMDNDEALLDFERERGYVLTCQSHPVSDDVIIEVGEI